MLRASPAALARSPRKEVVYVQSDQIHSPVCEAMAPAGTRHRGRRRSAYHGLDPGDASQVTGTSGSCPSEPLRACDFDHELQGLDLGVETLRQWMIGAGPWVRRKDRLKRIHQPRAR